MGENFMKEDYEKANTVDKAEIPLGFGMALAQNLKAMERFSAMSKKEQSEIIERTSRIKSKEEMRAFTDHIAETKF